MVVFNQFGNQALEIFEPQFLAVPTQKRPQPEPMRLDHFKCYRAAGTAVNAKVSLRDQFHLEKSVRVLDPSVFCNPVEKEHGPNVTPIENPESHLVCYNLKTNRKPFTRTVDVHNQFGDELLTVERADLLCVPSLKLSFGP